MANNLKISILGTLDVNSTVTEINAKLLEVQRKVNNVQINIQISPQTQAALNNLTQQVQNLGNANIRIATQNASNQINNIGNAARQSQAQVQTFGQSLQNATQKFGLWLVTANLIYAPIRALQDMTARLLEIDSIMTDIRRVMDVPDFRFTEMLEEAVVASDELSGKLTDLLGKMAEFGRMGFADDQLLDITKTAQVLQNISDLDSSAAVNTLTSAMLNFNIAAEDSLTIADKLNEVDNNFAISTKDLSDGIRKAAATAKTFGVDINELTGYIAAIGSTTRESGSIVGNGLKTIFSRLTTIEGAETALSSANVAMKDMQGNVRPVSDILQDLAGNWTSLSDEQRQNLSVTLAGRYQLTRFLALMNNFEIAQSATATAINSSGSAMKEQETYANSLEARINRLDTAWNKFTLSVGEAVLTDGLIGGIESLNDLATGVAKLVDKFGLLSGIFGTVGVAVVLLSTKFRTFATSVMFGTATLTPMQVATTGLTTAMGRLGVATIGVKAALRGLLASTVVGGVLVVLGFAIEKLIGNYSEAKQAQEEFDASQQKGIDALTKNKNETEQLIKQYNFLTDAKKQAGENWSAEQEQKYLQVQQQLSSVFPQLIKYIDGAGNAHLKSSQEIEKEVKATNDLIVAKKLETQVDAKKNISKAISDREKIQKEITRIQKELATPFKTVGYGENQTVVKKSENDIKSLKSQLLIYQNQWSNAAQVVTSKVMTVAEAYTDLQLDPNISNSVNEFFNSFDTSKLNANELEVFAMQIGEAQNELQKAYSNGDEDGFNKIKDSIVDLAVEMGATKQQATLFTLSFDGLKEAAEKGANAVFAGKEGMDGLDDSMGNLTESTMGLANAQGELVTVAERLVGVSEDQVSQIQEHIAAYQLLADAENQSEDQKLMLAEATEYLASMYPHLVEGSKLNVDAMQKEAEQTDILLKAIDEMKQGHLSAEEQMTLSTALNAKSRLSLLLEQARAYEAFARKLAQEADSLGNSDFARSQDAEIQARKFMGKATEGYAGFSKELEALMPDMDKWISQLAEATDYQGKNYKATEKSANSAKDSIYVSDKFKLALEALNAEIEKQNKLQDKYPNYSQEYRDSIKKEISLMEQKKELIEAQTKALDQQIKSGKIAQTGMISSSSSTPSYSSSSSSYASGGGASAQIWNFFKSKGFSDGIVAGIMGNLQLESGLNPNAVNKSSGASGIAQWLGGRKTGLQNFAAQRGTSWNDLNTQLEWLWKELNSSERRTLNYLHSNQNASATTVAYEFDRLFERSEGTHRPQRANYANQYLSQFAGTGGGSYVSAGVVSSDNSAAESAQNIDEAKLDLLQLQQDSITIANQIQDLQLQLVQSQVASYDHMTALLEDDFAEIDYKQQRENENSKTWISLQLEKEKLLQQEKKNQQDAINYLKEQIKTNKSLTQAQKGILSDDIISRTKDLYSIEQDILSERETMAERLIGIYKSVLEAQKQAAIAAVDKMIEGINKKAEEADYKKELSEKQKGRQGILNEMAQLSMNNSSAGKKRLAELQKELEESNADITDMQDDHSRDLRLDNLNNQKEAIETEYDNLLNDERNFAKMRSDVINGNTKDIQKILDTYYKDIKSKTKILGTSVVNGILDQITAVKQYLAGVKTPTKSTEPTTTPSNPSTLPKTETKPEPAPPKEKQPTTTSALNLRSEPSYGNNVVLTIPKGAEVEYLGMSSGWTKVKYNGKTGYAGKGYLKFDTGGFTGNDEGLAMLHKKEIVLNEMDTSNLLKVIDITRDLVSNFKLPDFGKLFKQPTGATGGNTLNLSLNIANMNGTKKDVDFVLNEIAKGVNLMGVKF
jgi:TP901 family phage tail tape measure protein